MFTRTFWSATFERALSTAAQAALLAWGAGAMPDVEGPWWVIPAAAGGGFVLAVLKALAAHAASGDGPSLSSAEGLKR